MALTTYFVPILLLFISSAHGTATTYQTNGLQLHNQLRAEHGAVPMALNSTLSTIAVNCAVYYAQKKSIDHSCTTAGAGENLYITWGWQTTPDYDTVTTQAINMWYAENETYDYDSPGQSTGVTGHFTQLVWNSSTHLGLGVGTSGDYTVVVGKYEPQGNMYWFGSDQYIKFKENVFPPVSRRISRSVQQPNGPHASIISETLRGSNVRAYVA